MPLYEYQCQQCGTRTEALQNFGAPPLTTCEACGGELKRLLSAPAVQFKGAGWYVTDYARKSGAPAKSEGKSDGAGKPEGAGESKPAATAESKSEKPAGATSGSAGSSGKSD